MARPDLAVTLLEPRRQRVAFLELVRDDLGLPSATVRHGRAESIDDRAEVVTARALGDASATWEATERLLTPGGGSIYWAGGPSTHSGTAPRVFRWSWSRRSGVAMPGPLAIMAPHVTKSSKASAATSRSKSTSSTTTRETHREATRSPTTPGAARIIAIANQKGGVGKSTTAVSLGAALADLGYRVLVVDLDPQGNASTGLGIRHEAREITVYDVIVAEAPIDDAIVPTPVDRLDALPSTIDLAGAEIELVSQFSREGRLKRALETVREGRYDFILLDCPPSLGLLTVNAMTAAEELIVPIQCEYYALEGLGQLLRNVNLVQQNINPGLRLSGIVMTMYDPRTKLSEQVVDEVRRFFGELVYDVIIPRTVRLSEAPGFGQPITVYDPKSRGAETYRELASRGGDPRAAPGAAALDRGSADRRRPPPRRRRSLRSGSPSRSRNPIPTPPPRRSRSRS